MMKRAILLMSLLALLSCRAKKEVQQMAVTAEAQTLVDSMAWAKNTTAGGGGYRARNR